MKPSPGSFDFDFVVEKKGLHPNLVDQIHGDSIVELSQTSIPADGVWTRERGREVYIFPADCRPLLLTDGEKAAAVHAGWRGAKSRIVAQAVAMFENPERLRAIVGPCIGACCFEVKSDFIASFEAARGGIGAYLSKRDGKKFFDLVRFVVNQDLKPLDPRDVDLSHWRCTVCSEPRLPSYRRNGVTDPRIRAWIRLKD